MKTLKTMKAVVCQSYGGPEVLKIVTLDKPVPKNNQILVKVFATTVNRTDQGIRTGSPYLFRFVPMGIMSPFAPTHEGQGTEFAGKIECIGDSVKKFQKGDEIFGRIENSCNAEYVVVDEDAAIQVMSKGYDYEMSTAGIEGAHYGHTIVFQSGMKVGHKVLVNGATGGIGSACIQILTYLGIETVAICNTRNLELIKSFGVSKVLDYQKQSVTDPKLHDGQYDFIIDTVTSSAYGPFEPLLKTGGQYLTTDLGPYYVMNPLWILWTKVFGDKQVKIPVTLDIKPSILFVKKMMDEGKWKPIIDRKYPLEEIQEAAKYVELGEKTGSVVITIKHSNDDQKE